MKRAQWVSIFAGAALGACFAGDALASYPAGVWARVESVTFEPNEAKATRIQIRGAAMLYDGSTTGPYFGYTAPAIGVLYYECPAGKEDTCALEWQDIKNNIVAPPDICVGLGDQTLPTGTLRPVGNPGTKADAYPISMGVLSGFTPCQALAEFLSKQPDGGAGGGSTSSSSSSSGTATVTNTPTTTVTTTTTTTDTGTGTGGKTGGEETPTPGSTGGCAIGDVEGAGAFGGALAMIGLAAAFARAGARRRR